jgi:hypothetical protein
LAARLGVRRGPATGRRFRIPWGDAGLVEVFGGGRFERRGHCVKTRWQPDSTCVRVRALLAARRAARSGDGPTVSNPTRRAVSARVKA